MDGALGTAIAVGMLVFLLVATVTLAALAWTIWRSR